MRKIERDRVKRNEKVDNRNEEKEE